MFSQDLIRGCHSTARREKKQKKETKRKTRGGKAQCFSSTKSDNDLEDWAAGMVALTTFKLKPDLFARLPAETMAIDLAEVIAVLRRNWQDLCPGGGDGCWGSAKSLNKPAFIPSKKKKTAFVYIYIHHSFDHISKKYTS